MTNALSKFNAEDSAPATQDRSMLETANTRASQEVQAAMVVAKKFPRDENASYARIIKACQRKTLAEQAEYAYPRGGETISGPSIRLAEMLAQNWGNLDFGIIELEQKAGESIVMSYAWDLETNTRQTKIFSVKHERHTKNGVKKLTDPRDIYEMTANQGARRLRACILGVIPGDVVDAARERCDLTLKGDGTEPLTDRARKMVTVFEQFGVTQAMIEKRLNHKLESVIEQELLGLRKIYNSLKDGAAKREDFFDLGQGSEATPKFVPVEEKKPEAKPEPAAEPPAESITITEAQIAKAINHVRQAESVTLDFIVSKCKCDDATAAAIATELTVRNILAPTDRPGSFEVLQ